MQDNYVGDIGDYGKYGLLREICNESLTLSVNWYQVISQKGGKQDDGKYINYLSKPQVYRALDPVLFDALQKIVLQEQNRHIVRIEQEGLFSAAFFSKPIANNRGEWHREALGLTKGSQVVFLDPDNGLETATMHNRNSGTSKHVKWRELKDYYDRGQTVVLYQHRPQMTKKEACIEAVMEFQKTYLLADDVKLLEFPKYTNRFYFIFLHKEHTAAFRKICNTMKEKWGKNDFCREIAVKT